MRDYLGDFIHLFWFLFMYSFVGLISSARLSKGCMVSGKENDVLKGNVVFHPYVIAVMKIAREHGNIPT